MNELDLGSSSSRALRNDRPGVQHSPAGQRGPSLGHNPLQENSKQPPKDTSGAYLRGFLNSKLILSW